MFNTFKCITGDIFSNCSFLSMCALFFCYTCTRRSVRNLCENWCLWRLSKDCFSHYFSISCSTKHLINELDISYFLPSYLLWKIKSNTFTENIEYYIQVKMGSKCPPSSCLSPGPIALLPNPKFLLCPDFLTGIWV